MKKEELNLIKADLKSKLEKMPFWKKHKMEFGVPGSKVPKNSEFKIGTTKEGIKTFSILISMEVTEDTLDWQEKESIKVIQKYLPDYTVTSQWGSSPFGPGRTGFCYYKFISNIK